MGNSVRGRSCWPVGGWFKIHWVVWIVCELLGRKEHDGWSMVCQKQIGLEDCSIVTSQAVPSTFAAVRFALNDGSREVSIQSLRNGPETTSVGPVPTGRHREQWPVGTGPTLDADRQVNSRQFLNATRQRMHYSNVVTTLRSVTFHQPSSLAARRATTSGLSFARLCSSRGSAIRSNNCGRGSVRGCTDL